MTIKSYLIVILTAMCCFCFSTLHAQGFLKTSGTRIVNGNDQPILLRGIGLGGWMLQEGYMYQLAFLGQQYKIREKTTASVGEEKAAAFYSTWLQKHTTRKDIELLASFGFNSIRLPMHYNLYTLPVEQEPVAGEHTWISKGFELTDSLLQWCKDNQLYLILDLHAAPGGQGNDLAISDRNPALPSLWESAANQQKTIALWKKLAARYANERWIAGYDIINEPNWGFEDSTDTRGTKEKTNAPLKKLMVEITAAIREVDSNHIIIIEGNGFGNNYRGILPVWDSNMVLSFHKYGNFNTRQSIQSFLSLRDEHQVPIWLGETGENFNTWFTEAIKLVENEGIGWCWWPHKKIGINNPFEMIRPSNYDNLLNHWSGKGPAITPTEAWEVLSDWLRLIEVDKNSIRRDVIDAMFRQVREETAIPFQPNLLKDHLIIQTIDYDLGAQGIAYFDKDTASYHYTPGVQTTGNHGRTYRNDGVDIKSDSSGSYVFHTEAGEWLQYTINVKKAGNYELFVKYSAEKDGSIRVLETTRQSSLTIPLSVTPPGSWAMAEAQAIRLRKGKQVIRIQFQHAGVQLSEIQIQRK